ncbi:DUF928 domain-containing protein [Scytonema sp. NUACC21]
MIKKYILLGFVPLGLSSYILLGFSYTALAQPKLESRTTSVQKDLIFQESFEPPGDGEPKDTSGAGSRDGMRCSKNEQPIRPLMPKRNYALTLEERPSIYINLPRTSARQVVLTFQDEAGKSYERAFLPITAQAGIVGFSLPDTKPPLKIGINYQWSLAVVCGKTVQPDDPVFKGWVQRVARSPEMEKELGQQSAPDLVVWYANRGYWYDMLKSIIQAKQTRPSDTKLTAFWENVLKSVGLYDSVSLPLK